MLLSVVLRANTKKWLQEWLPQRHLFLKNWTTSSIFLVHSKLNSSNNLGANLYDHLMSTIIFTWISKRKEKPTSSNPMWILARWPYLAQESVWCKVGFITYLVVGALLFVCVCVCVCINIILRSIYYGGGGVLVLVYCWVFSYWVLSMWNIWWLFGGWFSFFYYYQWCGHLYVLKVFYASCVNGSPYSCGDTYAGSNIPGVCSYCVY